ncbi:hypothetical protein Sjap_019691 [Stephania japonica]|uniref:Reverse transcriptase Ty1/copia-type domain-containing protein n=1 Tax=Stephania japonica TaxID=461633 RepID=A0AAP0F4R7_9MAGN
MKEEILSLTKNTTWELVPKPNDVDLFTCKWVYKLKNKIDVTIGKYKACLVVRGFSQQYGLDCEETSTPLQGWWLFVQLFLWLHTTVGIYGNLM